MPTRLGPHKTFFAVLLALCAGLALQPSTSWAQVEARQARPEELATPTESALTEVPSPMLLEVSLGTSKIGTRERVPLNQQTPGPSGQVNRVFTETERFVCDKARVRRVLVTLTQKKRKKTVDLVVSPTLSTDWFRQDLDLTVAIVSDGEEIHRKTWDDLTIGKDSAASAFVFASHSKSPKAEFRMTRDEFESLFTGGRAPAVRIIVDIQE